MDKDTIGLIFYADNEVFKRSPFINLFSTDDFSMWTRILHPFFCVCLLTTADTVMCHEWTAQRTNHVPVEDLKWVTPILDSVFKGHVVNMLICRHLFVTQKVK